MDKRQNLIYEALKEQGIIKEIEEIVKIKSGKLDKKNMVKTAIALEMQRLYEENYNLRKGLNIKRDKPESFKLKKAKKRIKELESMCEHLRRIYKRDLKLDNQSQDEKDSKRNKGELK